MEALSQERVLYLSFPVTVPAGGSVTVAASFWKAPSYDYGCSGSENVGLQGYDLVTALGSTLEFTGQTAALVNTDTIEIVRQNLGFDLENGVTQVSLIWRSLTTIWKSVLWRDNHKDAPMEVPQARLWHRSLLPAPYPGRQKQPREGGREDSQLQDLLTPCAFSRGLFLNGQRIWSHLRISRIGLPCLPSFKGGRFQHSRRRGIRCPGRGRGGHPDLVQQLFRRSGAPVR